MRTSQLHSTVDAFAHSTVESFKENIDRREEGLRLLYYIFAARRDRLLPKLGAISSRNRS